MYCLALTVFARGLLFLAHIICMKLVRTLRLSPVGCEKSALLASVPAVSYSTRSPLSLSSLLW